MKKRIIIFVAAMALIFAACAESADKKDNIELPLCISARLNGNESAFTAVITETDCIVSFDESHALSGTELHFDSAGGKATVGDFTRDVDISIFPAQEALIKALRGLSADGISGTQTENGMKYTIDEMTIMVYYDNDAEQIIGIETEESGRKFNFDIVTLEPYEIQSDSAG